MKPSEELRNQAAKLLEVGSLDALTGAATLLKAASEIEQADANAAKLDADRRKVEQDIGDARLRWKEFLSAVGPLLTTGVLAGTLVFQIYQGRKAASEAQEADKEKREEAVRQAQADEQKRFTDALKIIQTTENISPAATLLNSFAQEPQKGQARKMAEKLLLRAESMEDFQNLFSSIIDPVTPADLPTILDLNRAVTAKYTPLGLLAYSKGDQEDTRGMEAKTKRLYDLLAAELVFLSQKMAPILQGRKAGDQGPDLSSTMISQASVKGADLRGANITGTNFNQVDLEGCDLSGIKDYQFAIFKYSPWWHAARIDEPLLNYLETNAPYRPESFDHWSPNPVDAGEYRTNVARLKSLLPH